MSFQLIDSASKQTIPLVFLNKMKFDDHCQDNVDGTSWMIANGFKADEGAVCSLPDQSGGIRTVVVGLGDRDVPGIWTVAGLSQSLPEGIYCLAEDLPADIATQVALGWAIGTYQFTRYKESSKTLSTLVWPKGADQTQVRALAGGVHLTRDLINTPSNDMGPEELATAAAQLAGEYEADCNVIVGDELIEANYPAIFEVGKASVRAPRLIDFRWGDTGPKVTLVGKGVCFDTGGLDLKSPAGMLLMKKDMGGAAHVLGIAAAIMQSDLPCQLRVLIPAVENSVAGNAFRPSDVIKTRKGLTVEIGNTDAEGRLVLCDALAEASRAKPDLIIDFATLTGAARVALGTDLPAMFCNDDGTAEKLRHHSVETGDEVWRMPLHQPYRKMLDSKIADLNNVASGPYAGAITAALYLQEFVEKDIPWAHFDVMAYNNASSPGKPEGGEALGLRAVYSMIKEMVGE
ncbi:cytochrome C oxidase subunit II [Kiloniella spongiae]|uniref:Cytochrome C oxidase subunit II n=1 Tax=Kiloniella spongiae TaxID=1489064 RepID=A0A0H2MIT3_9PROT|nr:leucyl aminopeptidase family protein [Kiloniella spongiae]KLN62434.1 cytochrome C oxidase subunit II [Kiloniella spongiae]